MSTKAFRVFMVLVVYLAGVWGMALCNDPGFNYLHQVIWENKPEAVQKIVDAGTISISDMVDSEESLWIGFTAVHLAAKMNNAKLMGILLSSKHEKINLEQPVHEVNGIFGGFTALHIAVLFAHVTLVDVLLRAGANVYAKAGGRTVLEMAKLGQKECMFPKKKKDFVATIKLLEEALKKTIEKKEAHYIEEDFIVIDG